jgi:hypothetical protein
MAWAKSWREEAQAVTDQYRVGSRVRQSDWMLPRARYGDVVELGERAQGTPFRWVYVRFPGHLTGNPVVLRCSTAQLTLLTDTPCPTPETERP